MKGPLKIIIALILIFSGITKMNAQAGTIIYSRGTNYSSQKLSGMNSLDSTLNTKKNFIHIYPFSLFGSSIMLGYEGFLTHHFSLVVNGAYGISEKSNYYNGISNMSSYYGEFQLRYYIGLKNKPLSGVYMGLFGLYKNIQGQLSGQYGQNPSLLYDVKKDGLGVGYTIGYKHVFNKLISLDFYVGGGVLKTTGSREIRGDNGIDDYKNAVFLHPGFSLGIAL